MQEYVLAGVLSWLLYGVFPGLAGVSPGPVYKECKLLVKSDRGMISLPCHFVCKSRSWLKLIRHKDKTTGCKDIFWTTCSKFNTYNGITVWKVLIEHVVDLDHRLYSCLSNLMFAHLDKNVISRTLIQFKIKLHQIIWTVLMLFSKFSFFLSHLHVWHAFLSSVWLLMVDYLSIQVNFGCCPGKMFILDLWYFST